VPEDAKTTQDEQATVPSRRSPAKLIITIAVAGVIVAVAFAVMSRPTPGQRTTTDTSVTVVLAAVEGAAQAQYPITLLEGGDPAHESDHAFEALQGLDGVASATLDWSSGAAVLTVSLDPEKSSAQTVADALAEAGYLQAPAQ